MSNHGVHYLVTKEVAVMQSFIVLGLIPGTTIQITLKFWIVVTILYTLFLTRRLLLAGSHTLRVQFIAWRISRTVSKFDLTTI